MYKIILYNSGNRIKIEGEFDTYGEAVVKYNKLLEENKVFFPKKYMWNGVKTDFELVLTGPKKSKKIDFFRNELGGLVEVTTKGDFVVKKISEYEVEEEFRHKNTNEKIQFKDLIKLLMKSDSTKVVTSLNNKLVVEYYENDDVDLFVLKNNSDCVRLNNLVKDFVYNNGLGNFLFFDDPSKDNKIRLYDKIVEQLGVDRWYLIRLSTR